VSFLKALEAPISSATLVRLNRVKYDSIQQIHPSYFGKLLEMYKDLDYSGPHAEKKLKIRSMMLNCVFHAICSTSDSEKENYMKCINFDIRKIISATEIVNIFKYMISTKRKFDDILWLVLNYSEGINKYCSINSDRRLVDEIFKRISSRTFEYYYYC
jgi:hypothetical protein